MDGGSLRASNIKLAARTDYFVVSEHFARDYMSYRSLSTEAEIKAALIELNKICRGEAFITLGEKAALFKSGMLQIVPSGCAMPLIPPAPGMYFTAPSPMASITHGISITLFYLPA